SALHHPSYPGGGADTNASFTLDTYTHVTTDMQKRAATVVSGFMEDIFGKELKPWQESEKAEKAPSA
ncbi:MAG: hypothetical protein IJD13_03455, partial [Oscillospiraceae bacterium]|nr:hypothetical protein [Oscillospiraceae bacterium]